MRKLRSDETILVLTNRHKVFWPEHGYTKGDLLDYYREIAPVILAVAAPPRRWLEGQRVLAAHFTDPAAVGADGAVNNRKGERMWILTQDWPTLLWLVNFGCIEFLPWCSRVETLD